MDDHGIWIECKKEWDDPWWWGYHFWILLVYPKGHSHPQSPFPVLTIWWSRVVALIGPFWRVRRHSYHLLLSRDQWLSKFQFSWTPLELFRSHGSENSISVFSLGHHSSCFMLFRSKKSNCSSFFLKTFSFQRCSLWNIFPPSLWFIAPDGGVHPGTEKKSRNWESYHVVSIDLNIIPKTLPSGKLT